MPFQSIEPRRLYRQIADQLRGLVELGEYAVGSRLPPERDLALQLGVSRPSLREALIALKGPMGNVPAFRKHLQNLLTDETARQRLASELSLVLDAPNH